MQGIENPLTQIVNGIIVFLQSGEYKDTTGVAFKNQSVESKDRVPQNISVDNDGNYVSANAWGADYVSENKQYKTNTNMNKKLIKLTEADLKQIVKKSVNKILKEGILTESNDDVIMSFINPYRPLLSERFFEKVKRSFVQYVQFYGVDQLSEETMEEWLKGRISTMMETEIENRQTPHRNPYLADSPGRVLTNDYGEYLGTTD